MINLGIYQLYKFCRCPIKTDKYRIPTVIRSVYQKLNAFQNQMTFLILRPFIFIIVLRIFS